MTPDWNAIRLDLLEIDEPLLIQQQVGIAAPLDPVIPLRDIEIGRGFARVAEFARIQFDSSAKLRNSGEFRYAMSLKHRPPTQGFARPERFHPTWRNLHPRCRKATRKHTSTATGPPKYSTFH